MRYPSLTRLRYCLPFSVKSIHSALMRSGSIPAFTKRSDKLINSTPSTKEQKHVHDQIYRTCGYWDLLIIFKDPLLYRSDRYITSRFLDWALSSSKGESTARFLDDGPISLQLLDSYHARLYMQLAHVRTTSRAAAAIRHHYRTCAKSARHIAKLIGKCPMSDCYPTHCHEGRDGWPWVGYMI